MTTESAEEPTPRRRRSKPTTGAAYEARLHAMAYEVAEEQLRDRTISSQTLTHLLKEGSIRGQLELEEKRNNNLLIEAKIKNLDQLEDIKVLLEQARDSMIGYRTGQMPGQDA